MYYTFEYCKIALNNSEILANSISVSLDAQLEPSFQQGQRTASNYVANGPVQGSLKISYNLTGADFLKSYFTNETGSISGSFGGLFFKSGYLKNYSFVAVPNSHIPVNAEIVFWGQMSGSFTPTFIDINDNNPNLLNLSNASVDGYQLGDLSSIVSVNYNASIDIQPVIKQGGTFPFRVIYGKKQSTCSIVYDNLSGDLPFSGKSARLTLSLNDAGGTTRESYSITGVIFQKELGIQVNDSVQMTVGIRQDSLIPKPNITGFSPSVVFRGGYVNILGDGFYNVLGVFFGNLPSPGWSGNYSPNQISALVPNAGITSPITVVTAGGTSTSASGIIISQIGFAF